MAPCCMWPCFVYMGVTIRGISSPFADTFFDHPAWAAYGDPTGVCVLCKTGCRPD